MTMALAHIYCTWCKHTDHYTTDVFDMIMALAHIYSTWCKHTDHYTTDAVSLF
jgi:predicted nucleic-acid-binding Zn-ribbon protein